MVSLLVVPKSNKLLVTSYSTCKLDFGSGTPTRKAHYLLVTHCHIVSTPNSDHRLGCLSHYLIITCG